MFKTVLLLGSNKEPKADFLDKARFYIAQNVGEIIDQSNEEITSPYGVEDQPDFLNQVLVVNTKLFPSELLKVCKYIENTVGRKENSERWGAREIDVDILFFDDIIYECQDLIIPHTQVKKRPFVKMLLDQIRYYNY